MRLWLKISIILFIIVAAVSTVAWSEYQRFLTTAMTLTKQPYVYTVESGSNLKKISEAIKREGLIEFPPLYLQFYGRLLNKAHLIKTGEYKIEEGTTLPQLLEQFIAGQVVQYQFTIIEGMTSQQLIDSIAADDRLSHTLKDTELSEVMRILKLPQQHGEGVFLPETYNFTAGTKDIELLQRAYALMTTTLEQEWNNRAEKLPYKTAYEALIMASIIEKETGIAEERAEIAGVFVRRLNKGMRLQTDPTVIYGMADRYKGNIRRQDLQTDTPYNTYTRYGLPPSPIALPSKAAIHAALHPKASKSLYFVATGHEGRHIFSNTLIEHNKAVRQYQLKNNGR